MKTIPHLLLFVALLSGILACGRTAPATPAPQAAGDATRTLNYDGRERSYILRTPPDYDGTSPIPVVLVFHGGGGSAARAVTMTGFNDLADQFGFLAVYPNGTGRLDVLRLRPTAGRGRRRLHAGDHCRFANDCRRGYAADLRHGHV